jgi:glycosyltransferase involved in cell wall biosynthesis
MESRVTFTDSLEGDQKNCALSNSELFVLPTHSENFGIVIAEALARGLPAITTRGAPWRDLKDHGCGWWIEDNEKALRTALEEGLSCGDETRREMGEHGRELVATKYSWRSIADQMADFYRWICRGGSPPDCVLLNAR